MHAINLAFVWYVIHHVGYWSLTIFTLRFGHKRVQKIHGRENKPEKKVSDFRSWNEPAMDIMSLLHDSESTRNYPGRKGENFRTSKPQMLADSSDGWEECGEKLTGSHIFKGSAMASTAGAGRAWKTTKLKTSSGGRRTCLGKPLFRLRRSSGAYLDFIDGEACEADCFKHSRLDGDSALFLIWSS
jgi:hypothetical protein